MGGGDSRDIILLDYNVIFARSKFSLISPAALIGKNLTHKKKFPLYVNNCIEDEIIGIKGKLVFNKCLEIFKKMATSGNVK